MSTLEPVEVELKYAEGGNDGMEGWGYLNVYINGHYLFNLYLPNEVAQNDRMVKAFNHAIVHSYREGHWRGERKVREKLRNVVNLVNGLL